MYITTYTALTTINNHLFIAVDDTQTRRETRSARAENLLTCSKLHSAANNNSGSGSGIYIHCVCACRFNWDNCVFVHCRFWIGNTPRTFPRLHLLFAIHSHLHTFLFCCYSFHLPLPCSNAVYEQVYRVSYTRIRNIQDR